MSYTKIIAVLGLMVGAFVVAGLNAPAEDGQPPLPKGVPSGVVPVQPGGVDPKMPHFLVCAKACDDCARMCDLCAIHCAKMAADGKKEHLHTVKTCLDCSAICIAAGRVTAKDGPFSDLICTACADACKRCGDACEKHAADPIMKQCADECRRCEKECRDMLKHAKHDKPNK